MDENRIIHRFRPRPYDLRRKVLLKNFLREQMTYIPTLRGTSETSSEVEGESNFSAEASTSIGNEENIEDLKNDVVSTQLNQAKELPPEQMPSSSMSGDEQCSEDFYSNDPASVEDSKPIPPPKFSIVSTILKFKGSARKRRKKGISKAKHVYKSVKSPNKSLTAHRYQNKVKLDSDKPAKEKRSFFSLFKSRRERKNKVLNSKKAESTATSSVPPAESVHKVSQSVQTDISWSNAMYEELEQSHDCLKEENRLLSESLSFIIDIKTNLQKDSSVCTDSYLSNESNKPQETPSFDNHSAFNKESPEKIAQKCKLSRSKSVQEKHITSRICLRSRSMNFPGTSKLPTNNFPEQSSSLGSNSISPRLTPSYANGPHHSLLPQCSRPSVLKNLPINSSRTIVRRSSMPERTSREPIRPLLRPRSNSIRAYNQSSDTYRNPNSASRYSNRSSALKSLPTNSTGKPIVRRSSMPERIPRNQYRSLYRQHSVNNRDYYNAQTKYNRTRYVGDCSRSVPFRDLPNEAFY